MESDNEPESKKRRVRKRTIELDLDDFPKWVEDASHSVLIQVFQMGVMVKESVTMSVSYNQKYIDEVLGTKLEPVYSKVNDMAQQVSKQVDQLQTEMERNVGKVQNDVTSSIQDMQCSVRGLRTDVSTDVQTLKGQLIDRVQVVADKVRPLDVLNTQIDSVVLKLKPDVDLVSRNVALCRDQVKDSENAIQKTIGRVLDPALKRFEERLNQLATLHEKTAIKGAIGERKVIAILRNHLPGYTFEDVSSIQGMGDIHVTSPPSGQKYLIEVKNYQNPIPAQEIRKFEANVRQNSHIKVGILFSLKSGISRRASHRKFEITCEEEQYFVYVPNALKEENLIVWSVLLADELVCLPHHDLTDTQIQVVRDLFREFQESMERSKTCRADLKALKRTVESLEDNMVPLLGIIDKAKNALNRALHQKGPSSNEECSSVTPKPLRDFWSVTPQLSPNNTGLHVPVRGTIPEQEYNEAIELEKQTVLSEPSVSSITPPNSHGPVHETNPRENVDAVKFKCKRTRSTEPSLFSTHQSFYASNNQNKLDTSAGLVSGESQKSVKQTKLSTPPPSQTFSSPQGSIVYHHKSSSSTLPTSPTYPRARCPSQVPQEKPTCVTIDDD